MKHMIEILKKELEIYKEILKISEDKTDIIVKDKIEELKDMVSRDSSRVETIFFVTESSGFCCTKRTLAMAGSVLVI